MPESRRVYDVVITETAWEQILGHARFLAEVSASAANRLVDDFVKSCEALSFMPERCPWLEHGDIPYQKYRKRLISKNYMALFLIKDETVYITAAVDCRRDYSWLI
jgi:plasmid stabilization system protein ParE